MIDLHTFKEIRMNPFLVFQKSFRENLSYTIFSISFIKKYSYRLYAKASPSPKILSKNFLANFESEFLRPYVAYLIVQIQRETAFVQQQNIISLRLYVCGVSVYIILCLVELKYSKYYFLTYFHLGKIVLLLLMKERIKYLTSLSRG